MTAPTAGNVFSRRTVDRRDPITVLTIPVLAQVAASTTSALCASLVLPAQPGKVKAVLKRVRWINGATASVVGAGNVINIINVTNSNKNCGVITLTTAGIAAGAASTEAIAVLATTTTDRSATVASPVTTTTEPDINVLSGDQVSFQATTGGTGATLNPGFIQVEFQWLDNTEPGAT